MARKRRLTGEKALHAAYDKTDHAPLRKAWGVDLSDELLCLALTHRSFANENDNLPNNERLEFLGDAVLGVSVAEQLYRQYPDNTESDISKMRASVVNMYALAGLARELNLGPNILLGRGEMRTEGYDKDSILADTVEAILGAIYLEKGFDVARETTLRLFSTLIDGAQIKGKTMDWKTTLGEKLAKLKLGEPTYDTVHEGPAHDQTFHSTLSIPGTLNTKGTGKTKREAEHQAAAAAVNALGENA